MKLCWLIPSDTSGGVASVALSCCSQAALSGYEVTLLMLVSPTWINSDNFQVVSLNLYGCAPQTPTILRRWLEENPQDVIFFNACGEFEAVIPYLPPSIKCVFVAHDTAPGYWSRSVEQEDNLEAIIAVSETVATKFRHHLKQPQKLSVIFNGCAFPELVNLQADRQDDLIFLGGENPTKGAFDVINLWKKLIKLGFTGSLHWFGNVTPQFKAKIEHIPQSQRIHIYGHVQRNLIFSTAASVKVLLMLSRVESFGMSTIEAMSMGCIPVAWDVETGTKEIVTPQTGLFAALGDMQTLAQQVLYACENYSQFNHGVVEQARNNFNETMMWKNYEATINHIFTLAPIIRSKKNQEPVPFQPPVHRFQLLPPHLRSTIRELIGRSPRLGYLLRDLRGW